MPWGSTARAQRAISRADPRGPSKALLHWQTVNTSGTGATAETYAGDASSKIFRYEMVGDYFDYYNDNVSRISIADRYVKIYQP